ncbi:mechanosensitive ion channel domain-containing protein [Dokdonella sp.]|uniref:mechanosensitive ion channel domain-containing protein n=1 Tax=Dokdonella sp. TaxID=2291710 RepID=UPI0031C8B9D4|nr:mechanosensitive ion channel family protein [Dokdonella sp.]
MKDLLPDAILRWSAPAATAAQIVLIVLLALLLRWLLRRVLRRVGKRNGLPAEMMAVATRIVAILIGITAALLIMDRLGVSASVLWTAFTGFAAVGAVAFFAAWSVLSNIFCSLLIFTTRPFRLADEVELLENGENPGLRGRVADINLIYTTLREPGGSVLQVPNTLFFQRITRRWRGPAPAALIRSGAHDARGAEQPLPGQRAPSAEG